MIHPVCPGILCIPESYGSMRLSTLSRTLFLPALLLAVITTVTASALPTPPETAFGLAERSVDSSAARPILHKRLTNVWQSFLGPEGWYVDYITFAHILPIQVAVVGLQQLYHTVAVQAFTNQLTNTPLTHSLVIGVGFFELTLSSNQPISWALLHAFAAKMWTVSGAGFTPGYTIQFLGPSGTVFLKAQLLVSQAFGGSLPSKPSTPKPASS